MTVPLIQNIGIEIQRAKNMHQFRSKVYFCMAIGNAIVSVPLGIKFSRIGCALGTAISMIIGNGFIMNWYYQTHIGLDMVYFWKRILGIVRRCYRPSRWASRRSGCTRLHGVLRRTDVRRALCGGLRRGAVSIRAMDESQKGHSAQRGERKIRR